MPGGERLECFCWLLAEGLSYSTLCPSIELLVDTHSRATGFPQAKSVWGRGRERKGKRGGEGKGREGEGGRVEPALRGRSHSAFT